MKLSKKKLIAALVAALCVLGVADLTVLENSNIKDVLQKVEGFLGSDAEEAPTPVAEEAPAPVAEEAPAAE